MQKRYLGTGIIIHLSSLFSDYRHITLRFLLLCSSLPPPSDYKAESTIHVSPQTYIFHSPKHATFEVMVCRNTFWKKNMKKHIIWIIPCENALLSTLCLRWKRPNSVGFYYLKSIHSKCSLCHKRVLFYLYITLYTL